MIILFWNQFQYNINSIGGVKFCAQLNWVSSKEYSGVSTLLIRVVGQKNTLWNHCPIAQFIWLELQERGSFDNSSQFNSSGLSRITHLVICMLLFNSLHRFSMHFDMGIQLGVMFGEQLVILTTGFGLLTC